VAGYTALIDLRVNGLDGLKKVTDSITSINNLIKQIKPVPTLFDQKNRGGTEAERASVQKAKDALSGLVKAYADGNTRVVTFSTSMAGLSNQIRSFNVVVGNAKVGSENFVNGIVAAERASRKLTNAEYDRLRVLRNIYTAERTGGRTTTTAAQEVLERGRKILATDANGLKSSINELELYEAEIKTVFATVSQGTPVFRELQVALAAVNKELDIARGMGAIQGPALPAGFTGQGARSGGFPSSPIRGGVGMRGSPAALQARNAMMQNVLIGGAFPMLFGGGAGATLGGAAGGLIPGNPMMSIVTSALGTMVDEFAAAAIAVGAALMDTATTFDFVKEKSLFSSKELEKYATKLQEAGFVASASAVAQFDIIRKVGNKGVEDLATLASESDKLNRAFAELTVQMQAFIAGPLAVLLEQMAALVGQATTAQRAKVLEENLRAQGKTAAADKLASRVQGAQLKGLGQSFNFSNVDPLNPLSLVAPNTKATGNINEEIQGIINEFEKIELKPKIKLTPEQINKQDLAVLEKRLQTISIAKGLKDQVTAAAREQESVDRQRVELVRSYEQSLASLREKVEERVSAIRLQTLQKENQLLDVQSSIRLKSLEIANQQMVAEAGAGQRPELVAAAKEVAQIVADYTQKQLTTEEAQAKIKRDAALAVLQTDLEAAKFKINTEKEVSRLNTETARRVAEINRGVREKNQAVDQNKFKLEQQVADIQLKTIQAEFALLSTQAVLATNPGVAKEAARATGGIAALVAQTAALKPPAPIKEIAGVGGGGVSFAGVDKASADFLTATKNYVAAQLALNDLDPVKNTQDFTQRITDFANKTDEMFTALTRADSDEQAKQLRYTELISKGLTDTVAQKVIELETTKAIALSVYDIGIAQLQNKLIAVETNATESAHNELLIQQIDLLKQRKAAIEGTAGSFNQGGTTATGAIGEAVTSQQGKQLQEFINRGKADLNDLEAVAVRVSQGIGDAGGQLAG
jgi:hypothetical protein